MPTIFTIGHSTRSFDDFVAILKSHDVKAIADVRAFPRSRRYPHFNDDSLARELPRVGIEYLPFKSLGGRRKVAKDSINTGWRNESFRAYADFLQTKEFLTALDMLMNEARRIPVAVMCAEAVPWRCHRSLIADVLLARGWDVQDIMNAKSLRPHKLPDFARVSGSQVTYPAPPDDSQPTLFGTADERR